jgi:glycine/D-amino acid oxidase-like deaminating enzyme
MVSEAFDAWEVLWQDLGTRLYRPTGTLALEGAEAGWTTASRATLEQLGVPHRVLAPDELDRDFPYLDSGEVEWGLWLDSGGALFAGAIVEALASHLAGRAVTLRPRCRVIDLDLESGRAVTEDGEKLEADALVVAAGPWTSRLLPDEDLPITPSRQVVAYARPPVRWAKAWATAPMLLDVGSASGFYAVPPVSGTGLKIGEHSFTLRGDPDESREPLAEEAQAVFELCLGRFVDGTDYRLDHGRTCFYTVESQERFIAVARGRSWVLAGFSGHGFKFGAVLGLRVADAIFGAQDPAGLSRWAAGRHDSALPPGSPRG